MKNKVQKFGKFLSGMVMPNIGALIAFGFLAALFIDTGWIPNEKLNSMVSPMLTYLIPILIASTGGKMVGGDRGRVVGAIAVIGAIMSDTSITMLMAAMVMGPLAGFCIKKFDQLMASPLDTWARAGTSSHLTRYPAPWEQNTESAVFSTSRSGS